jgi:hypothetical protein
MRETGPVRKDLQGEAALPYMGLARTLLGKLKNQMRLGGLAQLSGAATLPDGVEIRVASRFGQDLVRILAPAVMLPAPAIGVSPAVPSEGFVEPPVPEIRLTGTCLWGADAEAYSVPILTNCLKGPVMDKTGKTIYAAVQYPVALSQVTSNYMASASLLMAFDTKMGVAGASAINFPDMELQLNYDNVEGAFWLNTFLYPPPGRDPFRNNIVRIGLDGGRTDILGEEVVPLDPVYSHWPWGQPNTLLWGEADNGAQQNYNFFTMSPPSTSGRIVYMFAGGGFLGTINGGGFPVIWDTRQRKIVWHGWYEGSLVGQPLSSVSAVYNTGSFVAPNGDAYFVTYNGGAQRLFRVTANIQIEDIANPPAGLTGIVTSNSSKVVFVSAAAGIFASSGKGTWSNLTPKSLDPTNVRAILHDVVTDAVAVVLKDLSGVWLFNVLDCQGKPEPPFLFRFRHVPTVPSWQYVFPQQLIDGVLLMAFVTSAAATVGEMAMYYVNNVPTVPEGVMLAAPPWMAMLTDSGGDQLKVAVPWILGRYQIGRLKQTSLQGYVPA